MKKFKGLSTDKLAILAYLTVCVIWGSTYLAIRIAVMDLPPLLSAGIRFTCAGLIMFIYAYFKKKPLPNKTQIRNQSIVGLLLLLGGNSMVVLGSLWLNSGIVSLLFATMPLFIAVGEIFLPSEDKLSPLGWLGLFVGFGGVAYLVLGKDSNIDLSLFSVAIVLTGAALWALGSIFSARFKNEGAIEFDLSIQLFVGGCGQIIVGLLAGEASDVSFSLNGSLAILYLIFFGSLLGYNAYIYLLSVWPATRAGTYTYVNPFVAMFLGYLVLREPLSFHIFIGTGIILTGVFMVQYSK
jgi:drug/metabolite transporter (DMT)-like permease